MKYRVDNRLDCFEFHDCDLTLVRFPDADLILSARHLNIHKHTPQNPSDHDMEIECATITFHGFRLDSYEPGRAWEFGSDGQMHPLSPQIIFYGQDAEAKLLEEFKTQVTVLDLNRHEEDRWFMDAAGSEPFFTIFFCFDSVTIEWDEYKKKAWYELHRQMQYNLTLQTPDGDEQVQILIIRREDAPENTPTVTVCLPFAGQDFRGYDRDYLGIGAFADVQKQLPDGVKIKCCLTCSHGNMCPVGNAPDELFCTKDVVVTQKSDLCFYTEDEGERRRRTRQYCHVCEDYQPQSEKHYTYNDFPFYLK